MGQKIYDPTIATDRLVTAAEINDAAKSKSLAVSNPMQPDQTFGFQMPPSMPEGAAQDILNAFPQLAGIIAQFTPVGRAGYKGAAAVPAIADMVMKAIRGEELDPVSAGGNALGGMAGHGVGKTIAGVGNIGTGVVRRSLGLFGDYKNRAMEEMAPKLAIREKVKMTIPGVDALRADVAANVKPRYRAGPSGMVQIPSTTAITGHSFPVRRKIRALGGKWDAANKEWRVPAGMPAARAQAHVSGGSGSLADLAEVIENARLKSSVGPNETGGGILSMIGGLIKPPRQMAIGSAMAAPFGVSTAETLAPTGEAGVRAFLAYIASQLGDGVEAPVSPPSGPRRRTRE